MEKVKKSLQKFNFVLVGVAIILLIVGAILLFSPQSFAQESSVAKNKVAGWGFLAASVAVGLSCIGAGIAVSAVGSAAMGAVSERPELMGRSLIYVGLAEGIAIYGLIVAIMILGKL